MEAHTLALERNGRNSWGTGATGQRGQAGSREQ